MGVVLRVGHSRDQEIPEAASAFRSAVIWRSSVPVGVAPLALTVTSITSNCPEADEKNAMLLPSGDQAGARAGWASAILTSSLPAARMTWMMVCDCSRAA